MVPSPGPRQSTSGSAGCACASSSAPPPRSSPTTSSPWWADAQVSRRDATGAVVPCTLAGDLHRPVRRRATTACTGSWWRWTRSCGRRCLTEPVAGAAVVIDFLAVPLGRALVIATGLHDTWMRKVARGTVEARLTVGDQRLTRAFPGRRATTAAGPATRIDTAVRAPARPPPCVLELTSAAPYDSASSASPRRRADDASGPPRRRCLVTARSRSVTVIWPLVRRGAAGDWPRRGPVLARGRALLGLVQRARREPRARPPGGSSPVRHRRLLERQRPEHPAVMKALYGLSWRLFHRCSCPGESTAYTRPRCARPPTLPLFPRDSTAFRFPAFLFAGLGGPCLSVCTRPVLRWPSAAPRC